MRWDLFKAQQSEQAELEQIREFRSWRHTA